MIWTVIWGILIVLAVADALGLVLWYACSWPRSQILGPALVRGAGDSKQIALTFDDGPMPPYTEQVLDILRERGVRATFFVCGRNVERHPKVVHRIHSDGHTIGNHTWSHPYLYFLSRNKIAEEIDRTQTTVQLAAGCTPRLFRPPYGGRWFGLYALLRERGMQLVQWSLSGDDWKLGANAITDTVRRGLRPGAVILLHDGRQKAGGYLQTLWRKATRSPQTKEEQAPLPETGLEAFETVKALPGIIDAAKAKGYVFVSLEDLFPARARADMMTAK